MRLRRLGFAAVVVAVACVVLGSASVVLAQSYWGCYECQQQLSGSSWRCRMVGDSQTGLTNCEQGFEPISRIFTCELSGDACLNVDVFGGGGGGGTGGGGGGGSCGILPGMSCPPSCMSCETIYY